MDANRKGITNVPDPYWFAVLLRRRRELRRRDTAARHRPSTGTRSWLPSSNSNDARSSCEMATADPIAPTPAGIVVGVLAV